jgi:hypothetical protein
MSRKRSSGNGDISKAERRTLGVRFLEHPDPAISEVMDNLSAHAGTVQSEC